MTDKFDDGGPAYPNTIANRPGEHGCEGMSLHDAFAMAAMQGILADPDVYVCEAIARDAYRMADAMIAERNKRRGEG